MSFINKYETSTLTPFVKPHNVLNLAIQNVFYVPLYVESAFTYKLGSTKLFNQSAQRNLTLENFFIISASCHNVWKFISKDKLSLFWQQLNSFKLEPGVPFPPPRLLKRKILIKNKRLRPDVERYELDLFKKGELAIEDSEEEKEDPKVSDRPTERLY